MEIGEVKTFKLSFWLKGHDFSCGENGLTLEKQKGNLYLMATDRRHKTTYCTIPLGPADALKDVTFEVHAHSKSKMLFTAKKVLFVFDFAAHKAATNLLGLRIYGSESWGEFVQTPWQPQYLGYFGLPVPELVFDKGAAELFWKWFQTNENAIIDMTKKGKKEAKQIIKQIELFLCPVFLYEKSENIEFWLRCGSGGNKFFFCHHGKEPLAADAAVLGEMMPPLLRERWTFQLEV